MFARLGAFVSHHWLLVIVGWSTLLVAVQSVAPRWDDVTNDGDFAFLPADMPSIIGQNLSEEAFPTFEAKSQVVLVVARQGGPLTEEDLAISDKLSRRLHNLLGVARFAASKRHRARADELRAAGDTERALRAQLQAERALAVAETAFDLAIELDPERAVVWHNRGILKQALGSIADSERDRSKALELDPQLRQASEEMLPAFAADLPLVDVWTRRNEVFGEKLVSADRQALLIVLQLSNEFMATANISVLDSVRGELDATRLLAEETGIEDLFIGISGSAAVGADMLDSAAESIENTELFTVTLVVLILLVVYRAPLLVLVPLATIGVSLTVSTGLLALLTQLGQVPGFEWWGFQLFKTTKIFVVVILFGAGTDFCLFLIARFREELSRNADRGQAVASALTGVSDALVASALTTIFGLGTMFFADFGKFRSSGPAIGVCLAVTLAACLTFAPAVLRALGPLVFWPFGTGVQSSPSNPLTRGSSWWATVADFIVARPIPILGLAFLLLLPLAITGLFTSDHVTFDLLSALDKSRPSIEGNRVLERHFPIGEGGPIIILAKRIGAGFGDKEHGTEGLAAIGELTEALREIEGVTAVRSLAEPLGDKPQRLSLLSSAGRKKLFLREHRLTKSIFVAEAPGFLGDVTRLELIPDVSPFSKEALELLNRVESRLEEVGSDESSFWSPAEFAFSGTTAGIRDLRRVTRTDERRIQVLVVGVVLAILWLILRDFVICAYLMVSVVFSYLVTIGATELFFQWSYGASFQGLDWKVPVFLFVILVAVGEDYNIYLVTRVFEEQARLGPFAGLRSAVLRTGGIITSCGVIMAGTFVSMTAGTLRGIVELGFALSLGVLLDTFVVRTILVPAFLSLVARWRQGKSWRR